MPGIKDVHQLQKLDRRKAACRVYEAEHGWDPKDLLVDETWMSEEVSGDEDEGETQWWARVCQKEGLGSDYDAPILEVLKPIWRSAEVSRHPRRCKQLFLSLPAQGV